MSRARAEESGGEHFARERGSEETDPRHPPAGASSGIGLSLARRLAAQGINVVMAALPDSALRAGDPRLEDAAAGTRRDFPRVVVRAIPVALGAPGYLEILADATRDITVSLIFNNAGYMVTGLYEDGAWAAHEANVATNSTAAFAVAHLFLTRLRAAGRRGVLAFTSSPANIFPSPFSVLYGATKAALTHFAVSLAPEVRADGVDVCVIHPSPAATRFYARADAMPTLRLFQATAGGPDAVADALLRGIGHSVVVDQGYYPFVWRLLFKAVDVVFFAECLARGATFVADYRVLKAAQAARRAAAAAGTRTPATAAASGGRAAGGSGGSGAAAVVVAATTSAKSSGGSATTRRRRSVAQR